MPNNLLEPEFSTSFTAWKRQPNPSTRGGLLKATEPVIGMAIRAFGSGSQESPTLHSRARLAALKAFETYDPARGSLRTHLVSQLRGLERAGIAEQNIIRIPERVMLQRQQLHESEQRLYDKLGRDPTTAELADHTGLSVKRISYVRQGGAVLNTGRLVEGSDEDGRQDSTPASVIPGQDQGQRAWMEYVYGDLDKTDQFIMEYGLGLHGRQRLGTSQIAGKLGLTPGAISQRSARIQALINERDKLGLF